MLIRSYGLFWKWEHVFRGAGSQAGALYGYRRGAKTGKIVDFREQRGVYALYAEYDLVYVGQVPSLGLFDRLKMHADRELADRWNRFSWFGTRWVTNRGTLSRPKMTAHVTIEEVIDHMEAILIYAAEPPLNRSKGPFGDKVQRYIQYRDLRLGPTTEEMVKGLWRESNEG